MMSNDQGLGVIADNYNSIYVTGRFNGTVDFDPGPGIDEHTSSGLEDAYICRFLPDGYW
jgi:hypothetical protein